MVIASLREADFTFWTGPARVHVDMRVDDHGPIALHGALDYHVSVVRVRRHAIQPAGAEASAKAARRSAPGWCRRTPSRAGTARTEAR